MTPRDVKAAAKIIADIENLNSVLAGRGLATLAVSRGADSVGREQTEKHGIPEAIWRPAIEGMRSDLLRQLNELGVEIA